MAKDMMISKYNWGEIPIDIAAKIRDHLELYDDYEAFSVVCSSWRLATKEFRRQYINRKNTQLPMLILADKDNSSYLRYYSLTKNGFLKIDIPPCIPAPQVRRYFSSRGWLISVTRNISKSNRDDIYFNITIFNPFSNNMIIEAPLFHINEIYPSDWDDQRLMALFWKFAVSTCPNARGSDDFVVAVIFGDRYKVAYWRVGHDHNKWVASDYPGGNIKELCFFRGELYGIQCKGFDTESKVISFGDFKDRKNSPQPRVVSNLGVLTKIYQLPPGMEDETANYYMMESKNDESDQAHSSSLLLILRYMVIESYDESKFNTVSFNVFKLNVDNPKFRRKCKEVKSLGNKAIFVGLNSTFSVNADPGCKTDCIYYTEDVWDFFGQGSDIGTYNLQGGNIVPFYQGPSQFSFFNTPTWIELCNSSA